MMKHFVMMIAFVFTLNAVAQTDKKTGSTKPAKETPEKEKKATPEKKPTPDKKDSASKSKDAKKPAEEVKPAGNLISDSSFELEDAALLKNLKSYELLTTTFKTWGTPNLTSADLFNTSVKSTKTAIPKNDFGIEEPLDGKGYAGFRAFTKDPKKYRTYLQGKFPKKLTKDKRYCIRFNVSLADLSKWGVNNIGMFLSDRKVQNNNDYALTFVPQITAAGNAPVMENQGWEKICGNYIASGKEEYFIIGCFGEEAVLQMEKNKKPANIEGNIIPEAYYYLDKIEVNEIDDPSACYCGKAEDQQAALIFSRSRDLSAEPKAEEVISKTTVWFAYLLTEVPAMFDEDLASVVKAMQENPTLRIQLSGHCDDDEFAEAKIKSEYAGMGLMRANAIKDYLIDKGIESSRIMIESKDNNSPGSTMKTPLGKAQNRRVTFSVL